MTASLRIGLISDTHNLLRDSARDFLRGSDLIIHAGDVCGPAVLAELSRIAPVVAVRGNNDKGEWAAGLPQSRTERVGGTRIHVIHDIAHFGAGPEHAGVAVIVYGHSHRPLVAERDGVLYVNPGSAGPRRFKLPISAGELVIESGDVSARLVELS
jgi:putative phosphoesterase